MESTQAVIIIIGRDQTADMDTAETIVKITAVENMLKNQITREFMKMKSLEMIKTTDV